MRLRTRVGPLWRRSSSQRGGGLANLRQIVLLCTLVAVGNCIARVGHLENVVNTRAFATVAAAVLAIGLYAGTSSIALPVPRQDLQLVGEAISIGVVLKATLIGGVLAIAFQNPVLLVLGPVLAQIDPLSVSALQRSSALSTRGRGVLAAWSAFDDPITALIVVLLGGYAASIPPDGVLADPLSSLASNILLVAAAWLLWRLLLAIRQRLPEPWADQPWTIATGLVLIGLIAAAIFWFLALGIAVVGLFFRPNVKAFIGPATTGAFIVATLLLGIVTANGLSIGVGLVVGFVAFGAQVAVGYVVARNLPHDRTRLAMSQQSGITAVILALLLEPAVPGTVAIVAPAIVIVNVLHLVVNATLDNRGFKIANRHPRQTAQLESSSPMGTLGSTAGPKRRSQ